MGLMTFIQYLWQSCCFASIICVTAETLCIIFVITNFFDPHLQSLQPFPFFFFFFCSELLHAQLQKPGGRQQNTHEDLLQRPRNAFTDLYIKRVLKSHRIIQVGRDLCRLSSCDVCLNTTQQHKLSQLLSRFSAHT